MTASPLITCIVPVHNGERFLAAALDSLFEQTYRAVEVVVVDDGSTDGTSRLLEQYADRVSVVTRPNGGPAAARNTGLAAVRGDWVAFLDSDDLWHPEKLTRQMRCFEARPELEMCISHTRNFWEAEARDEEVRLRAENSPYTRDHPGFICQAWLLRMPVFEKVGLFNEALRTGEDTDWYARAKECGIEREILSDVLVYRRMHRDNISRTMSREERLEVALQGMMRRRRRAPGD